MNFRIIIFILICTMVVACGNDAEKGQVQLAISTEDGIENFGLIVPTSPNYSTNLPWLTELQIRAYAGTPETGALLMDERYSPSVLESGEYITVEIPSGNNLYFMVNAIDRNKVIQYAGTAGPVNIQPNSVVALTVVMTKLVSTPLKNIELTLNLKYLDSDHDIANELERCGTNNSNKVYAHIYTRAVKVGDQWIPTNPDNGIDYSVGGSYSNSQWNGGSFFSNTLQFITIHVEDDAEGVVFYGIRAYDSRWDVESPLTIYMRHPSTLVVTLSGSNLPTSAKVQMHVNNNWRDLYIRNTFNFEFNPQTTNPVVVDAPSGEGWFTGASVQTRRIRIFNTSGAGGQWGSEASIPVDWGVSSVTIYGP